MKRRKFLEIAAGGAVLAGVSKGPEYTVKAGDVLSIHGQTGEVFVGSRPVLSVNQEKTDEDT